MTKILAALTSAWLTVKGFLSLTAVASPLLVWLPAICVGLAMFAYCPRLLVGLIVSLYLVNQYGERRSA